MSMFDMEKPDTMKLSHKTITIQMILAILFLYTPGIANTNTDNPDKDTSKLGAKFIEDDPIIENLDKLAMLTFFKDNETHSDENENSVYKGDPYDDSIIYVRMQHLNNYTPISLDYNEIVKGYIEFYLKKRYRLTKRALGLSELYFPLFESFLDQYDLPMELKYLAIVESALNPTARSRAGASGLWQFMLGTGKIYGLEVNSLIDERFDPIKSTRAACEHFCDLYDIYKDWQLVLAAYNSGAGNVNKAIRRSGGEMDFWKIMDYLPRETQGYVPAFIAVTYIMSYSAEYNITAAQTEFKFHDIDSVFIKKPVTFSQISEFLDVPYDQIAFLNPEYKRGIVPFEKGSEPFYIYLPKKHIGDFINNEYSIYQHETKESKMRQKELASIKNKYKNYDQSFYYVVKSGDVLSVIADAHNCSTSELMQWNNLYNTNIYPGQKLYIRKGKAAQKSNPVKKPSSSNTIKQYTKSNKFIYHTVQKGDTLWDIANKYKGASVQEIKDLNNLHNNAIKPGQKLKIGVKG